MANENYTSISNECLLKIIDSLNINPKHQTYKYFTNHHPILLSELIRRTSFLDDTHIPIQARLYCIKYGITYQPKCNRSGCNNSVEWNRHIMAFKSHCCCKCAQLDPTVRQKAKNTNLKLRGVEYPGQSEQVKTKIKNTCNEKYDVDYAFQAQIVKQKIKNTLQLNHGVDNPMKCPYIKQRLVKTLMDKYHVINYSQTIDFHKKCHKRYTNPKYPDMSWATSWEFKVYDFLTENHIPFEYQPSIAIPFYCEGTHHTYHPDFKVGDRIVEVKGDNFFRINPETGEEEMYLTWQGNLSDEEYEWKCKIMEAKHQCMLTHNVMILREHDIKNLSVDMFSSLQFPNNVV